MYANMLYLHMYLHSTMQMCVYLFVCVYLSLLGQQYNICGQLCALCNLIKYQQHTAAAAPRKGVSASRKCKR